MPDPLQVELQERAQGPEEDGPGDRRDGEHDDKGMDVHTEELAAPAGRDEERGAVVVTFAVVFAAVELVWVAAIVYAALRLF